VSGGISALTVGLGVGTRAGDGLRKSLMPGVCQRFIGNRRAR
jgi:hypothetical protein